MSINFEIPCLTEEPTKNNAKAGLFISLFVFFIIILLYGIFGIYDNYKSFAFFEISNIIMGLYALLVILIFNGNLIVIFRFLLLFIPIFLTSLIWYLYEGKVYVHHLGTDYQTLKTTYKVVFAGYLSSIGAAMGWFMGILFIRKSIDRNKKDRLFFYEYLKKNSKKFLKIGIFGSIISGLAYYVFSGGSVFVKGGYVNGEGQINVKFAAFNAFHMFFTALTIISSRIKYTHRYKLIFFVLIISYFLGILVGSRADYLFPILILLIIVWDGNFGRYEYIPKINNVLKRYIKLLILIFLGFYFALSIGFWRYNLDFSFWEVLIENFKNFNQIIFIEWNGKTVFWMETAGQMIGGLYAMISKIELGYMDYLLGRSYFAYIPRILPSIIRPESFDKMDLAWHTDISNEVMTQGGIFEPAEAYANFGFLGCFTVSFTISLILAWLLKNAKSKYSIFFMSWYLVSGFIMSRAVWYQNFVFIRVFTVIIFLYIIFFLNKQRWFFGNNPNIKKREKYNEK